MNASRARRQGAPGVMGVLSSTRTSRVFLLVAVILVAGFAISVGLGSPGPHRSSTGSTTAAGSVLMSLGPAPHVIGPGITMNYTLTLFVSSGVTGPVSLSAFEGDGISVKIEPTRLVVTGDEGAADVSVKASQLVTVGSSPVTIGANWSSGSTFVTFEFSVVQHLILLLPGSGGPGEFVPANATISAGSAVTWLSLDAGSDEYGGVRSVEVAGLGAASPALHTYDKWTFTFAQPGVYSYDDPLNPNFGLGGVITVTGS